jgi:hypothetical protein
LKVKALVSFAGVVTMTKGEVREISNKSVYEDLLKAKYVEGVKVKPKKKVKTNAQDLQ